MPQKTPRLPYSSLKKSREIETIETPDGLAINLLRRGCTTANENPTDIQKLRANQRTIQSLLDKAVGNYAAEHDVSEVVAREQLLAAPIKSADPDQAEVTPVKSFIDYLPVEDRQIFVDINEDSLPVPTGVAGVEDPSLLMVKAATIMIANRTIYAIRLAENAREGATTIRVEGIKFPVEADQRFEFGDTIVTVTEYCEESDSVTSELMVEPLKRNLLAGRLGLLKNFETGAIEVGFEGWTEEHTIEYIPSATIRLLYDFYCAEALGLKLSDYQRKQAEEATIETAPGKSKKSNGKKLPSSTGPNSTGESSPTDGTMNGSVPSDLVSSPST